MRPVAVTVPPETSDNAAESAPPPLIQVGAYSTLQEAFEHGLVVLAMGFPYWLEPELTGHRLLVESPQAQAVGRQLACFDRESASWPPKPVELSTRRPEFVTPLLWALSILATFWGEATNPKWVEIGGMDAEAVFSRNEWWRAATALFLHADAAHLVANAVSGVFAFSAVVADLGRGRGWLSIAIAAVLGNIAAAALNGASDYHSLGASTAVFAAVGLLTGRAIRGFSAVRRGDRVHAVFAPFAAGCTVLALYGAGGLNVDVLAHATGFAAGLLTGVMVAPPAPRP